MRRIGTTSALAGLALVASLLLASCWLGPDYNGRRSGFNPLETTLNTSSIGGLHQHWSARLGTPQPGMMPPFVSQPVTDGNAIYVATGNPSNTLVALDPATGAIKWTKPFTNFFGVGVVRPVLDSGQLVIVQPSLLGSASVQRFSPSTGDMLASELIPAPGGSSVEVAADGGQEAVTVFGANGIEVWYGTVASDPTVPVLTHVARVAPPMPNQAVEPRPAASIVGGKAFAIVPESSADQSAAVAVALDPSCTAAAPCAPLWTHFTLPGPSAVQSRVVGVDSTALAIVSANTQVSPVPPGDFLTGFLVVDATTGETRQGSSFLQNGQTVPYTQPATDGSLVDIPRIGAVDAFDAVDCSHGHGDCFPEYTLAGDPGTPLTQTIITDDLVFAAGNTFVDVFPRDCPLHTTCSPLRRLPVSDGVQSIAVDGGQLLVATNSFLQAYGLN
jgi:hypothetical protein